MPALGAGAEAPKHGRPSFYREALTPLLHRRFTRSAGSLMLVCWVEAFIIGSKQSFFWSWFPIGPAGLRALLLFIPALSIFVMRVANIHFGMRTSPSVAIGFFNHFFRSKAIFTIVAYFTTAWFFYEVYVWSAPPEAGLSWILQEGRFERQKLNEKPIYLKSHFFLLAFYQTIYHVLNDADRVLLPCFELLNPESAFDPTSLPLSPSQRIKEIVPSVLMKSTRRAAVLSLSNLLVYTIFLRRRVWDWTLHFARIIYDIPQSDLPPATPPFHYTLIYRSIVSGILLVALWDLANTIFDHYVAQAPLKKGRPLTDDSKDPNGRLIDGLRAKKEIIRVFAFWELLTISRGYEDRRKAIFSDIDRQGGSAWGQILKNSLGIIQDMSTRMGNEKSPPPDMTVPNAHSITLQELPKLSAPLQQGSIFSPGPRGNSRGERYAARASAVAKHYGESPVAGSPLQRLIFAARNTFLSDEQQESLIPNGYTSVFLALLQKGLATSLGAPFRQSFAFRCRAKVLGTPVSSLEVLRCAIGSVSCLAVSSLKDDRYGTVYKDVPLIIRTLVNSMNAIQKFMDESPEHWTDVEFRSSLEARKVAEVSQVLEELQLGLRLMVLSFEEYAQDLGLGAGEMCEARKAGGLAA